VEWVRNTYSSAWRLFRDRLDVLTPGQYVRCPAGAPHYRDFHNLGSANWRKGTDETEPPLGEPSDGNQIWTRSEPLPLFPLPLVVGSGACLSNGDSYASRLAPASVFNGFDLRCWAVITPTVPTRLSDIPLSQRSTLIAQSNIVNLLYTDPVAAAAAAVALLGPGTTTIVEGDGSSEVSPVTMIATNGPVTIVFITGTTNYQQAALQAMFSLVPPSHQAGYGTLPVWQAGSNVVNGRITAAGIPTTSEIRFVGHSYGGAVACLLAAQYKRYIADRRVELLTFGCPKPGDQRLYDLLVNVPSMSIMNVGDPIPSLPPSLPWLFPFMGEILQTIILGWAAYVFPPNTFHLSADGVLTASNAPTFGLTELAQLIEDALTSTPPAAVVAHGMAEYWTRISLPQ